jgi:hypothetical protein
MKIVRWCSYFLFVLMVHAVLHAEDLIEAPPNSSSHSSQIQKEMFQLGEELEYSVHYSFFNIGTIRFKITDQERRNDRIIYRAQAIMDSNPSLSWLVDLHIRFYSEIDQDAFSYGWLNEDSTSKRITYRKMVFDYLNHKMYYESGLKLSSQEYKPSTRDTIKIIDGCQDGLSLFYYARAHVFEKEKTTIPTFIDTSAMTTNINFGIEHLGEDMDAVDYSVDGIKLDGHANFVGVFGLTGGFEGVFSNDNAGIPITARMKVILGSVRVELRKWKRAEWVPPRSLSKR